MFFKYLNFNHGIIREIQRIFKTFNSINNIFSFSNKKQIQPFDINQFIKSTKTKVQPQTQSDFVRVSSKKKDDLQAVMQDIKGQNFDFDVQFTNYR